MLQVTNVGSGYITQRQEFLCPHAGLYVFYIAGYATNNVSCRLAIMKNDVEVGRMYTVYNYQSTGTNMFTL